MTKIIHPESMILMPAKSRLEAVFDMLKQVFEADSKNLPGLYVHPNDKWTDDAWVDSKGHIHMCEADYFQLKNWGLPTVHLQTVKDVAMFKIGEEKDKAIILDPDQKRAKNSALMDSIGPQTLEN